MDETRDNLGENKKESDLRDREILAGVLSQINAFDSKADILISVISIILALSLSLIDILEKIKIVTVYYVAFSVVYCCFVTSAVLTILFSILVVMPRTTPIEMEDYNKNNNVNYYMDLIQMDYPSFKSNKKTFFGKEESKHKRYPSNNQKLILL